MATKNLDALKARLYEAFDLAVIEGNSYIASCDTKNLTIGSQALLAATKIAEAIVSVEREQRKAAETKVARLAGK